MLQKDLGGRVRLIYAQESNTGGPNFVVENAVEEYVRGTIREDDNSYGFSKLSSSPNLDEILEALKDCGEGRVVLYLPMNAKINADEVIDSAKQIGNKVIVLTTPNQTFSSYSAMASDASFELGASIMAARLMETQEAYIQNKGHLYLGSTEITSKNIVKIIETGGSWNSRLASWGIDSTMLLGQSVTPDFIRMLGEDKNYVFHTVCLLNSYELRNPQKRDVLQSIKKWKEGASIVTYGLARAQEAAEFIRENGKITDSCVIVTSSRQTMVDKNAIGTDVPFNLGSSCMAAKLAKPGIYVVLDGSIYDSSKIVLQDGKFIPKTA